MARFIESSAAIVGWEFLFLLIWGALYDVGAGMLARMLGSSGMRDSILANVRSLPTNQLSATNCIGSRELLARGGLEEIAAERKFRRTLERCGGVDSLIVLFVSSTVKVIFDSNLVIWVFKMNAEISFCSLSFSFFKSRTDKTLDFYFYHPLTLLGSPFLESGDRVIRLQWSTGWSNAL